MKKYIFFCYSTRVGGGQSYVNQKIDYLKKHEWFPIVFTSYEQAVDEQKIVWKNINALNHYYSEYLTKSPEFWSKKIINSTLKWMESVIDSHEGDEVLIESHTSYFAEWGELLAERVYGRNFCFIIDEIYNDYGVNDLLYFKFKRGELAVIHKDYVNVLFRKYIQIDAPEKYRLSACPSRSVEDIGSEIKTHTESFDINIMYLGRYKQYCEEIKNGIREFSQRHLDKSIQFLIIGDIRNIEKLNDLPNLTIHNLGFINPIPRILFKGIDVGIAGSGSASTMAREGVPTIVTNPAMFGASGILGFTVYDTLSTEQNGKYEDMIDDILYNRVLKGKRFNYPKASDPDEVLATHFQFLSKADKEMEYFDLYSNPQNNFTLRSKVGFYMRRFAKPLYDMIIKVDKKNPFSRN